MTQMEPHQLRAIHLSGRTLEVDGSNLQCGASKASADASIGCLDVLAASDLWVSR